MFKKIKFYILLIFFIFFYCCSSNTNKNQLVVAIDVDMPGYFTLNGKSLGFQYELLSEYANSLGYKLKVVPGKSAPESLEMLSKNKIDIAAMLKGDIIDKSHSSVFVYNTSYVVLTGRKNAQNLKNITDINAALSDKKVVISHGFTTSDDYNTLLDSVKNPNLVVSSRSSFELIESLSKGNYDYIICERSEAHLGCSLVKNVSLVYDFNEDIPVYALFNDADSSLCKNFSIWLNNFNLTPRYAELSKLYFEKGIANYVITSSMNEKQEGGISSFDGLIKRISENEHVDWRLVAAVAYNESKFNPYIVSPNGASGLMQIMPSVAREFGIDKDSIMNPEKNILLGVKLIKKLEKMLKLESCADVKNKMSIVLACYNGGIGHIGDARRLASKYGGNPNEWSDVAYYLKLKSQQQYAQDNVVKSGRFTGTTETVNFVSNVMSKYESYCKLN